VPLFAFLRTVHGLRVLPVGFVNGLPRWGADRAEAIIDAQEGLKLDFPKVDGKGARRASGRRARA
jgi:hypothetical protein